MIKKDNKKDVQMSANIESTPNNDKLSISKKDENSNFKAKDLIEISCVSLELTSSLISVLNLNVGEIQQYLDMIGDSFISTRVQDLENILYLINDKIDEVQEDLREIVRTL